MPTPSEKPIRKRFASWGWPLLPALAALAVYANAVPNGFALDDVGLVAQNPQIRSLSGLPGLFVEPYWPGSPKSGLHRPVTIASFALNHALTGSGPAGFHAVNVSLHALVCLLVWFFGRRAGVHYGTALATAVLFAVHPLHTEAVANIAGRGELLAAAGVLAAWLCHRRAWDEPSKGGPWVAGAALFYALALLSKEHVILAPLLFLIDDRLRSSQPDRPRRTVWRPFAGYCAALVVAGTLRFLALGGFRGAETTAFIDNPAAFAGLSARIGTALWVQVKYAGLLVWPSRLSSDYSFDAVPVVSSWGDPRLWVGIGFLLTLLAAFAWCWRRSRPLTVGIAIWVLFFLPTSNLFFATGTVMGERLAYLPSLGGCLIAGHFLAWLASASSPLPDRGRLRAALPIFLALSLSLVLGARAASRNPAWRDNATLAIRDAEAIPNSAKLHAGAGIAHADGGDTGAAERSFRRALEIYPDYAQVRFNLGQLLMHRGDDEEAIQHLSRAALISPDNPRPYKSLATLYEQGGNRQKALLAYALGTRLDPSDLPLRFNFGRALLAAGRNTEAQKVLDALADEAPGNVTGVLARALSHEARDEFDRADELYRELLERDDLPAGIRANVNRRLSARPGPP